jgi:hypothetical protein
VTASYPASRISGREYPASFKVTNLDTKRKRRTKADILKICRAMHAFCAENRPVSVRQVFYHLTTLGAVAKTEQEYTDTVCRLLTEMRMTWFQLFGADGDRLSFEDAMLLAMTAEQAKRGQDVALPMDWIADASRWKHVAPTYLDLRNGMSSLAENYRRSYWDGADAYVEIWVEKEALAAVMDSVTHRYAVPLMPAHGYSSVSFLWSAAQDIAEFWNEKPAYIYLFGDRDPHGLQAHEDIEAKLRLFAPDIDWHFKRAAVTRRQIAELDLPTRPTKRNQHDHVAKKFRGDSVELDAIPPPKLRELVEDCIKPHVDEERLEKLERIQAGERAVLQSGVDVLSRVAVL